MKYADIDARNDEIQKDNISISVKSVTKAETTPPTRTHPPLSKAHNEEFNFSFPIILNTDIAKSAIRIYRLSIRIPDET